MTVAHTTSGRIRVLREDEAGTQPYVPGLVVRGELVFVSGQIPMKDGLLVDGPIESQVQAVLDNIAHILEAAGASLSDVVRCGVFVADLDDLPEINAVYGRAFQGNLPTRTTVSAALPGYGIEIDCVAVVPAFRW